MSVKKRSRAEWRELIAQYEASGQTQEEWCLAHGVNLYTMRDRARRLRQMDSNDGDGQASVAKARNHWVEVEKQSQESQDEPKKHVPNVGNSDVLSQSEIRISVGVFTVSVTDSFNDGALIRVLNALNGLDRTRREAVS